MIDYVSEMVSAVRGARQYFPMDRDERVKANIRLGREFGYGLGADWPSVCQHTYGSMIVANSLDSVGVAIDMHDWHDAVKAGVELQKHGINNRNRPGQSTPQA